MGRTTEYFKGTGLLLCRESISTAQVRKFSLRARTVHSARRRGALTFVQRPARMIALCRILDKQSHFELDAHEAACFPDAVLCQPSHGNCSHKTADAGGVKPFMDTFGRLCCLCCLKSCLSTPNEVNRSTPSPMCRAASFLEVVCKEWVAQQNISREPACCCVVKASQQPRCASLVCVPGPCIVQEDGEH